MIWPVIIVVSIFHFVVAENAPLFSCDAGLNLGHNITIFSFIKPQYILCIFYTLFLKINIAIMSVDAQAAEKKTLCVMWSQ